MARTSVLMLGAITRSPNLLAAVALCIGLVARHFAVANSVGWVMCCFLWLFPALGILVTLDEYLPGGWGNDGPGEPGYFSSTENRLELLAILTLPAIGFAIDDGFGSVRTLGLSLIGAIGVAACARLTSLERTRHRVST